MSHIATVESVSRLNNSAMGNPAWMIHFTDGTSARTSANVSFSYELTEHNYNGKTVDVHTTKAGRITHLVTVNS